MKKRSRQNMLSLQNGLQSKLPIVKNIVFCLINPNTTTFIGNQQQITCEIPLQYCNWHTVWQYPKIADTLINLKNAVGTASTTYLWTCQGLFKSATYTWEPHVRMLLSSMSVSVVNATTFVLDTAQINDWFKLEIYVNNLLKWQSLRYI